MPNKESINIQIEIKQWWIDWHSRDRCYFCAIIQINNNQYQYIERELEAT